MNEDITKLLSGMLQNPDALKGLLGSSPQESSPAPVQDDRDDAIQSMLSVLNRTDDRRITLLNAIKPYMSPGRAEGIDRAIRILKLTKISELLRNERD